MAKILLVDDQKDVRFVMSELLDDMGHEVLEADSAASCLNQFGDSEADLVLLDLHMPDVSGQELLAKLRKDHPGSTPPVVILTGSQSASDLNSIPELGIQGLIHKPWTPEEVETQLEGILSEAA
jgi:CheY-like chemotaxis protein